jgi:hypothetical protein
MKNLILCLAVLFFLVSCSNDDNHTSAPAEALQQASTSDLTMNRSGDIYPVNSDNPYDYAGIIHNEILSAYYEGSNLPTDIPGIAEHVKKTAETNINFMYIKEPLARDTQLPKIEYILSHPNTCVNDIIAQTGMSPYGKSSLNAFIVTAIILEQPDIEYSVLYDFVCKFEGDIIANPMLTESEKRTILITSSITRCSVYMKKKRPKKNTDPEWDMFIANRIGGTYGANYGSAEAIRTALTAGIAQNLDGN